MGKFEEVNGNVKSIITPEIDTHLHKQGFEMDTDSFERYYYKEDGFSVQVTIKRKSVYFYRRQNGFFISDEYVEMDGSNIATLSDFINFMDQTFEEHY